MVTYTLSSHPPLPPRPFTPSLVPCEANSQTWSSPGCLIIYLLLHLFATDDSNDLIMGGLMQITIQDLFWPLTSTA
jgi:hypothetical protein